MKEIEKKIQVPEISANYVLQVINKYPPSPCYWIAYSGGMDSEVLLKICSELRQNGTIPDIRAIHVDHGLQSEATLFAKHCQSQCHKLSVPLKLIQVKAHARPGESPEEAARNARYQAILDMMAPGDTVLTAQHQDDQAETMLLQLLRGAGLAGLAAMPERSEFGEAYLLRPFLECSRTNIQNHAESLQLNWVEDPSNQDMRFDRNYIRGQIMPMLRQRWPSASTTISRSAGHCAEAEATLQTVAHGLLKDILNPQRNSLCLNGLKNLPAREQRLLIRKWIQASGYRCPSAKTTERIIREMFEARPDRSPRVKWSDAEIRRFRNELFILPPEENPGVPPVTLWPKATSIKLPGDNGSLQLVQTIEPGLSAELWQKGNISVRYRNAENNCRMPGKQNSHSLKKFFQEQEIPPWIREKIPLIFNDDELLAIPGYWVNPQYLNGTTQHNLRIDWYPPENRNPPGIRGIMKNRT